MKISKIRALLESAGFDMSTVHEISDGEVTIAVMDAARQGVADYDKTEVAREAAFKILGWGGYRCGWGGWVLQENFVSDPYPGTKASWIHY